MPAPNSGSDCPLKRSKAQGMLPLVPQYEGHARRTEAARTVIQQQRRRSMMLRLSVDQRRLHQSQDFTSSTRRLFARPSAVLLSAEGLLSP